MNISIDTANAAMNLAGGTLALLAAIIAAAIAILPKERAIAAIQRFRANVFSLFATLSALGASASAVFFDAPRFALLLIVVYAISTSINFIRLEQPATRAEILALIVQISLSVAFAMMFIISRVVSLLERHA